MATTPTLDVTAVLAELGIEVTRETNGELYALCPGHERRTGNPDTRASWSINETSFAHHCFSCGYSGGLQTLYMDVTGMVPDDLVWQITKASVQNGGGLSAADMPKVAPDLEDEPVDTSEWALRQYADVPQKLLDLRHLSRHSVDFYGVRWDKPNKRWVLPIRDSEGIIIGYQFRQKGTELNLPKGMEKSKTLFGFHEWDTENVSRIALVESPLDAVRMWAAGIPCLSSYGAWVSDTQLQLLSRNFSTIVLAMDNDGPGNTARDFIMKKLQGHCIIWKFDWSFLSAAKDPGDVSSDSVLHATWLRSQGM